MASTIPIKNIYYLLCYAWDRLAEGEVVDISGVDTTELADLFATVLLSGVRQLRRRGLGRGYESFEDDLRSLRGRVSIAVSARRLLLAHGRARCEFDELSLNTLENQIIRASVKRLASVISLDAGLRADLRALHRDLEGIEPIRLSKQLFRRVQLHGNARFYRFVLSVCELIWDSLLVDEETGHSRFRDFTRDPKRMPILFESFILNFYRIERPDLDVGKEKVQWALEGASDGSQKYLPSMETDISIRDRSSTVVIEAKYYAETLSSYYDAQKLRSGHLYQLFAYLKNLEQRGGADSSATGIIIYPTTGESLSLDYRIHGHRIGIRTLDLAQEWRGIRASLFEILDGTLGPSLPRLAAVTPGSLIRSSDLRVLE